MSDSSDDEPNPKRRRGVVHEEKYQRNIIRNARLKGLQYVSYKGKEVPSKAPLNDVNCKCPLKCYLKLTDEIIREQWETFYSLESKNTQDTYLQALMEVMPVKRRRKNRSPNENNEQAQENPDVPTGDLANRKSHSYKYNLKVNGALIQVCRGVFLKVFQISDNRVKRINKCSVLHKSPLDMRGKSRSGNALPGNVCVRIQQHIEKFDVKETHYGGKPKKYLDARLDVAKMHAMFILDNPDLKNKVKYSFYNKYYKENFAYCFGRPQVDVCSTCERLSAKLKDKGLSDNAKRNVAAEKMVHSRRAKKFYKAMDEASKNKDDDTVALAFDYMQNLPLPHIPVQEVFYMRQLWVNVFSLHDLKTNSSKLYVYHEGEANKGPDEVCSMLLKYFNDIPVNVKHLILFCDGPSGQNKNHTVVRFLLNLCDSGRFETITHNFPVRGHSFSPCDRDFGSIKRLLRKTDRIYTPDEYAELMLKASKCGRFTVYHLTSDDVLSFKKWWPKSYKKMTNSDETSGRNVPKENKQPFKVSKYKQFLYNKDTPGKLVAGEYIGGIATSTFTLLKTANPPELPTEKAYPLGKVCLLLFYQGHFKRLYFYF